MLQKKKTVNTGAMTCGPGAHVAPRASPPGLSGRGAGKRRRACNYAPLPERPGELLLAG